jgi:uncharacterized protein (DUF2336 family)
MHGYRHLKGIVRVFGPVMRSRPLVEEFEAALASGSVRRRIDILERITDLFIGGARHYSKDQIDLFDDVMTRLVRTVVAKTRIEMAERLAPIANAPAHLIRVLAFDDDAEVAGPVLSQSARLADRDLLQAARIASQRHLLAIARRASLSEAVTDILIERGDRDVVRSLVRHTGARFSKTGLHRLVDRSRSDEALVTELGSRLDVGRFAREGKFAETVVAFAQLSGMPIETIERILLKPEAEAILILAKAAGLSTATARAVLQLRRTTRGLPASAGAGMPTKALEQALQRFDGLQRESAERVLSFFRIRVKKPAEPPPAFAVTG